VALSALATVFAFTAIYPITKPFAALIAAPDFAPEKAPFKISLNEPP
jgi:hypothetical protein